jgi:copper homeostasis protein
MRWAVGTRVLIEAAVETPDDARAAEAGGADRLELCAALDLGGLTPTVGALLAVQQATRLPVVVMVRPRQGDFVTTDEEALTMATDVAVLRAYRPAGFVFGCLRPDGEVNLDHCRRVLTAAGDVPCVFHRAFDRTPDPLAAVDVLADLGFCRLLTSGREDTALEGAAAIAAVARRARGRVEALPCGRVRGDSAEQIVRLTGCDQLHGSFAEALVPPDLLGYRGYPHRSRTSREQVAATRQVVDQLALGRSE